MPESPDTSARDLTGTMEALRGFALGFVIYALDEIELLDALEHGQSADQLRSRLHCGDEIIDALLSYLLNEQVIAAPSGDMFILTERGRRMLRQKGWFRLFIGGYEPVLRSLSVLLRHGTGGEIRNMAAVARGSGEISPFDAVPLILRLIERSGQVCGSILDVGCGNGQLLCEVLQQIPAAFGIAVDPSQEALVEAERVIAARELSGRIQLALGDAFAPPNPQREPDFILAAFTLQEILGSSGEDILVERMTSAAQHWPDARWIVVEVDHQPGSDVMRMMYGLGYYNPYFLLHPLTRQRLLPRLEWIRIFERAGLAVQEELTADPAVDPTGFELGFLLRRRER